MFIIAGFLQIATDCLQTLSLLFKFVTSGTKESFVTRTNALLVGTLISIGDVSVKYIDRIVFTRMVSNYANFLEQKSRIPTRFILTNMAALP